MKIAIVGSDNIVNNILVFDSVEAAETAFPDMTCVEETESTNAVNPGYTWHPDVQKFSSVKPFASWTLSDDYITWNPPQDHPLGSIEAAEENGEIYYWDEAAYDGGGQGWTRAGEGVEIPQPDR